MQQTAQSNTKKSQSNNMTMTPAKTTATGVSTSSADNGADESLTDMVKAQLPPEAKESLEKASKQLSTFYTEAKSYISENPREAILIGVSLALSAWTIMRTAPGKKAFTAAQTAFMPRLKEWFAKTFNANTSAVH